MVLDKHGSDGGGDGPGGPGPGGDGPGPAGGGEGGTVQVVVDPIEKYIVAR